MLRKLSRYHFVAHTYGSTEEYRVQVIGAKRVRMSPMMAGDNVANGCFSGHLNDEEKDDTRYSFDFESVLVY